MKQDFADFALLTFFEPTIPLPYLIPTPNRITYGHNVVVIGYASEVSSKVFASIIKGIKETPSERDMRHHFLNYNHKVAAPSSILGPGHPFSTLIYYKMCIFYSCLNNNIVVLEQTQRLLVHNASTTPAASGSVVHSLH